MALILHIWQGVTLEVGGGIGTSEGPDTDARLALLARSIWGLTMAQALAVIHGRVHGLAEYARHGGTVRINAEGSAVI